MANVASSTSHDRSSALVNDALPGWSRRNFLATTMISSVSATMLGRAPAYGAEDAGSPAQAAPIAIKLRINDQDRQLSLDVRTTLLDALREHAGLTGTKKGCDHGQCGACTVLINDRRVLSCLTLAASAQGQSITTIEGLAGQDGTLDHDAFQCGYCTPGQIISAVACVKEGFAENDADIREYMSGNLCRCAAYPNIVDAIKQAKLKMKEA